MTDFVEKNVDGLALVTAPGLGCPHGFTTRVGGVSRGIYASLNLGESRGDEPEAVRENVRRLKAALGIRKLCFTKQVHGNTVLYADAGDAREVYEPFRRVCDGLVTDKPGVGLIVFTADCIPILLHDPVGRVIAAVHAGWRGTVADIAGNAVRAMEARGSSPGSIRAAIGPGISRCCFETGPEVPEAVLAVLGREGREYIEGPKGDRDRFFVDLKGVNRALLLRAGLAAENIWVCGECTVCDPEKYWSHRVTHGERGSQGAVIVLPENT